MKLPLLAVCSLAACVDASSSGPGSTNADIKAAATTISIVANAEPSLVVFRQGAGPWQPATRMGPLRYQAEVSGPYSVMTVCVSESGPFSTIVGLTLDDAPQVDVYCGFKEEESFSVRSSMVQSGTVSVGPFRVRSTRPKWDFETLVPVKRYDVTAVSDTHVAVRRDVDVFGPVELPALDAVAEGQPLASVTFTPTNSFPGETPHVGVFLVSPQIDPQAQIYRGPMTSAKVVPDAVLDEALVQEVSLRSEGFGDTSYVFRSSRRPFHLGDGTGVTFWDPFQGLQLGLDGQGRASASWQSLALVDYAYFDLTDEQGRYAAIDLSRSYLEQTSPSQVTFAFDAPGFLPEWAPDLSGPYSMMTLLSRQGAARDGYTYSDQFNVTAGTGRDLWRQSAAPDAPSIRSTRQATRARAARLGAL
jgi:hypothetical protein